MSVSEIVASTARTRDFVIPMFTIYDKASDRHDAPMVAPTKEVAKRRFSDMVNTNGTVYFDHPEDFVLQEAGNWNLRTGKAEEGNSYERIATGLEVKNAS